jgi:hypothetical protein
MVAMVMDLVESTISALATTASTASLLGLTRTVLLELAPSESTHSYFD